MFWCSSISVYKLNNKSIAVKLSLTQYDIDQDELLTLTSHACQKLLFPSCQVVITKVPRCLRAENKEHVRKMQKLFGLNFDKCVFFDSTTNLWLKNKAESKHMKWVLNINKILSVNLQLFICSFCHDEEVKGQWNSQTYVPEDLYIHVISRRHG